MLGEWRPPGGLDWSVDWRDIWAPTPPVSCAPPASWRCRGWAPSWLDWTAPLWSSVSTVRHSGISRATSCRPENRTGCRDRTAGRKLPARRTRSCSPSPASSGHCTALYYTLHCILYTIQVLCEQFRESRGFLHKLWSRPNQTQTKKHSWTFLSALIPVFVGEFKRMCCLSCQVYSYYDLSQKLILNPWYFREVTQFPRKEVWTSLVNNNTLILFYTFFRESI